jgi:hypothetical protein
MQPLRDITVSFYKRNKKGQVIGPKRTITGPPEQVAQVCENNGMKFLDGETEGDSADN